MNGSYSLDDWADEKVQNAEWTYLAEVAADDDSEDREEIRCPRCRGTGVELVEDQETDCLNCEGYGSLLI